MVLDSFVRKLFYLYDKLFNASQNLPSRAITSIELYESVSVDSSTVCSRAEQMV